MISWYLETASQNVEISQNYEFWNLSNTTEISQNGEIIGLYFAIASQNVKSKLFILRWVKYWDDPSEIRDDKLIFWHSKQKMLR